MRNRTSFLPSETEEEIRNNGLKDEFRNDRTFF